MNFDEYERGGREAYAKLAESIADIIKMIVDGMPAIRMQQIQHRAKSAASLRVKLIGRKVPLDAAIEKEVKDLAGCRVIFYTNADVETFLQSRVIFENFDVDWDRTKFHYPRGEGADEHFVARNYVVKLKDERAALPEYIQLRDKWCEVQVQTTLNHAWSEMAHDTLYKPPASGFGSTIMADVERRMNDLMNKYLRPAGFDFQKVVNDVRTYQRGRDLFDRNPLALLQSSTNTREINELLEEFQNFVLPYYDDMPKIASEVRTCLIDVIKNVRTFEAEPYQISGVEFPGKKPEETIKRAVSVLSYIRFLGDEAVEQTFDALIELYPGAASSEEATALIQAAKQLASHQMRAWEQVGPGVQAVVMTTIMKLTAEQRLGLRSLFIPMLAEVLGTEIEGTSAGYNTLTLHRGAVTPSEGLAGMRRDALSCLEEFYDAANSEEQRKQTIDAMRAADSLPHSVAYGSELVSMTLRDAKRVVEFLTRKVDGLSFELRQKLEHDILWLYRHRTGVHKRWPDDAALKAGADGLLTAIAGFRHAANRDPDFIVHKTLVGFESVFDHTWDADAMDIEAEDKKRQELIEQLASSVAPDRYDYWLQMVRRCAQTQSNDLATFPKFAGFLELVARRNPDFGLRLLNDGDNDVAKFIASIMIGLAGTSAESEAKDILRGWIAQGKNLADVAFYCGRANPLETDLLIDTFESSIELQNLEAVSAAVGAVGRSAGDRRAILGVFLPGIRFLTDRENYSWVWNTWYLWRTQEELVKAFTEAEIDEILANLVGFPRIDYRAEELLHAVALRFPGKVIAYFGERVRLDASDHAPPGYEEIPFDLYRLDDALRASPTEIVTAARHWFDEDDKLFAYRGGRFVSRVFPEIGPVEEELRALVKSRHEQDIAFVLTILQSYSGEAFLVPLALEIVDALEAGDKRLGLVGIVLDATGVVSGEYGLAEAYQEKRALLSEWENDARPRVADFVQRHIRELDNQIAAERQLSEEGVELRKRDYPENDA